MGSFGLSIALSPLVRLWRTVNSELGAKFETRPVNFDSRLSYEEAEDKFNDAIKRLVSLLEQQPQANSKQAKACLDNAVQYASRMNEICGGPHGIEFKQSLRRELLLDCVAATAHVAHKDEVS